MVSDVDPVRSGFPAQEIVDIVVADDIAAVAPARARSALGVHRVQRPTLIGCIGDVVVVDGVVVVARVARDARGGAEKNNARSSIARRSLQRAVFYGVGACVTDEPDGGCTRGGQCAGVGDRQALRASRGVHPPVDGHVVGSVQVDQWCRQVAGYAQPRRCGIDVDSGVKGCRSGQCRTRCQ